MVKCGSKGNRQSDSDFLRDLRHGHRHRQTQSKGSFGERKKIYLNPTLLDVTLAPYLSPAPPLLLLSNGIVFPTLPSPLPSPIPPSSEDGSECWSEGLISCSPQTQGGPADIQGCPFKPGDVVMAIDGRNVRGLPAIQVRIVTIQPLGRS